VTSAAAEHAEIEALVAADPEALADPWPIWANLREQWPVVEIGPSYYVTRHADVKAVLLDPRRFSNNSRRHGTRAEHMRAQMTDAQRTAWDEIFDFQSTWLGTNDGERHDQLRRIIHRAFIPRRIAELEAAATRYVDELVTRLAEDEVCDLMQLAYSVPLMIIGDLCDVPEADRDRIKGWSNTWWEYQHTVSDRIFESVAAQREFCAYVEAMVEEHRHSPNPTGLVNAVMGAEQDERLTPSELPGLFFSLLFAGHETTTNLIGTGIVELLRNRAQWDALCEDPGLATAATEELLRYVCAVAWVFRVALEDVEVAGTTIPAGATVLPVIACANRDPRVFSNPDVLDIARTDGGSHIALGFGAHFCLGASLARLETAISLRALATRFPQLELATDTLEWRGGALLRGPKTLPVRLGPERRSN
jgi:cytochrome P450